ncbi:hypothetical protein ACTHP3_09065 [Shouchella rhizosphaerae]|uniref:hypothetical protein n=1 Tax=Shouchella rhizosphaerae TaxID=866786 RepID=UPI003F8174BF
MEKTGSSWRSRYGDWYKSCLSIVFEEILGITGFGIEARFFELGKDAIKAIKEVSNLWEKINY